MEITGRVTANATVHSVKDNKQVVNFNIAVNDYYRTKSGEKKVHTEYFRCAYWLSTGVANVLTKGTVVQLYGRVGTNAWMDDDGKPKASLQFTTSQIKIIGGGDRQQSAEGSEQTPSVQGSSQTAAKQGNDDDLPF